MTAPGALQAPAQVKSPWFGGATVPVTQGFMPGPGAYEPYHTGIDVGVPMGTQITSDVSGTVQDLVDPNGFGNYEEITVAGHPNEQIILGHLSKYLVPSGAKVSPGEVIALSGDSGWSTGPHTHLQVDVNGQPVDPSATLEGYGVGGSSSVPVVTGLLNLATAGAGVTAVGHNIVANPSGATSSAIQSGIASGIGSAASAIGSGIHGWALNNVWPQVKGAAFPLLIAAIIIVVILKPGSSSSEAPKIMPVPV